jgi:hypothetical protein
MVSSDPTMSSIIKDHNAAFTSVGLVMLSVTYVSLVYLLLRKRDCFFFNVMYLLANGVVISVLSSIFSPFLCGFMVLLSLFSTIFVILSQSKRFRDNMESFHARCSRWVDTSVHRICRDRNPIQGNRV